MLALQFQSKCKTRGANGLSHNLISKAQEPGAEGINPRVSLKSPEPGAAISKGWRRWISSLKQENNFILPLPFCSINQPSQDQIMPTYIGKEDLLYSVYRQIWIQVLISFPNTLTDIPRNNILPAIWAPLSPVKLTHTVNHDSYRKSLSALLLFFSHNSSLATCCCSGLLQQLHLSIIHSLHPPHLSNFSYIINQLYPTSLNCASYS